MTKLSFNKRNVDIPSDLRLYRRLAMLSVSLSECCYGQVASLRQLHFLNSLYRDEKFRNLYLDFKSNKFSLKILSPSIDPYLNRCINYAIGIGIVEQKKIKNGYRLKLTQSGHGFIESLKKEDLVSDIFFLSTLFGKISEKEIDTTLHIGN